MWSGKAAGLLMGWVMVLCAPAVWASDELTQVAEPAQGQSGMALIGQLKSACQELSLNGELRDKIDANLAKAAEDAEKAGKDAKDERAAYGKISEVMRGATVEIMRLLDDDQKLMFQSKMRAAASNMATGAPATEGGGTAEVRAVSIGQRIRNAVAPLKLSDDQNKEIEGVVKDLEGKISELRNGDTSLTKLREKMQSMRQDLIKQMREILTQEQFAKFQENVRQPQNGQGGIAGVQWVPILQRLRAGTQQLGITAEQQRKVDAAFFSANEKLGPIFVKLRSGGTPASHDAYLAASAELKDKLQSILTAEQWDRLGTYMVKHRDVGSGVGAAE